MLEGLPIAAILYGYGLVLARLVAIAIWLPFLRGGSIPRRVTLAACIHIALAIYIGLGAPRPALPAHAIAWIAAISGEVTLGCALGLVARVSLAAARGMGQIVGQSTGFAFATFVDPGMSGAVNVIERLTWTVMGLVLVASDAHVSIVAAFFESFLALAPGQVGPAQIASDLVAGAGSGLFLGSLALAAPALGIGFMVYASLAVLARVSPQMNLFTFGFALTIGGGIAALWAAAPATVVAMGGIVDQIPEAMRELIRYGAAR